MSDSDIKVSILVPVYGVERYIARCAESLFRQTYQNIEYIFVNDCTKDGSMAVLEETMRKFPERASQVCIVCHEKNRGLAAARNTAVAAAKGEFVMHVDSDDYVDEQIVEKAVEKQKESDADIVAIDFVRAYPGYSKVFRYSSFEKPEDYCLTVLTRNNSNSIWAKLIRRSLYIDHNIKCKEGCNQGEDFQVVPQLLYHAKSIVNLQEPLYFYDCLNVNSYSNNFSVSKHDQNWESMDIVRDYFADKGFRYNNAVIEGRLKQLIDDLIVSAKTKGETAKYYYKFAVKEISTIGKKYWETVPLPKRITLLLSKHYAVMKTYTLTSRALRQALLKLKSHIRKQYSR